MVRGQEQRALGLAAAHEARNDLPAGLVPRQQGVGGGVVLAGAQRPPDPRVPDRAGAAVVDERHQRIELVLLELDAQLGDVRRVLTVEVIHQQLTGLLNGESW